MHIRLKERLLCYLFVLLLLGLCGKLIFVHNDCKNKNDDKNLHGQASLDPWNINEHHIEYEISKAIQNIRRSSSKLKPINIPDIDHAELDSFKLQQPKPSYHDNWDPHQLGIVVPYQNRFEELKEFVPHMHKYLTEKNINHKILIINQVDKHRFNRASLINVGFLFARNRSCDYIAMHDVDLMPINKDLSYNYPELGPFHVSAPNLHPKYHYDTFVGGILLVSMEQFEDLNGLSNKFWGWGREDDEFYMRIVDKGYKIGRHGAEIDTGYDTFKHEHSKDRKRDYTKLPGQRKAMFKRDYDTGLDTLKYDIKKIQELYIDGSPCFVVDVEIHCDLAITPWCDLPKKKNY